MVKCLIAFCLVLICVLVCAQTVTRTPAYRGAAAKRSTAAAPFSPPAGNTLWLKPEGLSLNDNDPVSSWPDSSGLGNNVAQGTGGIQPVFKTGILNGYGVVRFDADKLVSTVTMASLISASANTVFVVCIPAVIDQNSASRQNNDGLIAAAGSGTSWGITFRTGYFVDAFNNDGSYDYAGGVATSLAKHLIESRHESGTLYISQDGGSDSSVASGNTASLTMILDIGDINPGDDFNGDIAEILVFNVALSSGDRTTVRDYLNSKYAIY